MKFLLDDEHRQFAQALTDLLNDADSVAVARAWTNGDTQPGKALWSRLCELGLGGLLVADDKGGMGAEPLDMVVAFETLGHQLAVGPWIESVAYLPLVLPDEETAALVEGSMATVAAPPQTPYATDAAIADSVYVVANGSVARATADQEHPSVDTTRKLTTVQTGETLTVDKHADADAAFDLAALACAAQLQGCGERLLADAVSYVQQRQQYGRTIGSYQAIKHQLADVRIALDFSRPLIYGAALSDCPTGAAKVAANDAAYLAARTALQMHGAIGYTAEFDLGMWITRVRALVGAWGSNSYHHERLGAMLGAGRS